LRRKELRMRLKSRSKKSSESSNSKKKKICTISCLVLVKLRSLPRLKSKNSKTTMQTKPCTNTCRKRARSERLLRLMVSLTDRRLLQNLTMKLKRGKSKLGKSATKEGETLPNSSVEF
jgi:hypothetical protein